MKPLNVTSILFTMASKKFVPIEQRTRSFPRKKIRVSFFIFNLASSSSSLVLSLLPLVYLRSSSATTALFTEYVDLIEPLANIDKIEILQEEASASQTNYIPISTTTDYTLFFQSK